MIKEKGEKDPVFEALRKMRGKSLNNVVYRMCGAKAGQWCAYPRVLTANGRAVAVDPDEARFGIRMQCQFRVSCGALRG